jgi:hypothetical protein
MRLRVGTRGRLVIHGFFFGLVVVLACDAGDVARPGNLGANGQGDDGGGRGEGAGEAAAGEAAAGCTGCSLDSDCQRGCGQAPYSNYVWCCSAATCYPWPNSCPAIAMDAAGGDAQDSAPDGPPDDGGLFDASGECEPTGTHGGHRWQDLFACYFGPTGVASCGSTSGCHSQATDPGTRASNFLCGSTSTACWQSLTTWLLPADAASDPTATLLYTILCKSDGSGLMPRFCPIRLWTGDMARIAAWIQAGAPND